MKKFVESIKMALANKNYYVALFASLALPDICGKIEYPQKSSQKRYVEWYQKYLQDTYTPAIGPEARKVVFLCGNDLYALRCAFLHEGSDKITSQKARGVLEKFEFVHPDSKRFKPHGTRMNEMLLYLQVDIFCHDMIMAVEQWLQDVDTNPAKKRLLEELSAIYYYF
jgi:hypothetical protein